MSNGRRITIVAGVVVVVAVTVAAIPLLSGPGTPPLPATMALREANYPYAHAVGATTLAGTGAPGFGGNARPAVDARLDAPAGIVEDASGDLFIADAGNCRVREVAARTGISFGRQVRADDIVTVAGGSCSDSNANPPPSALAVDAAGDLFIAYGPAARVEELPAKRTTDFGISMTTGKLTLVAGTAVAGFNGDGASAVHSEIDDPTGVAVDPEGDLLISDTGNCRLRLVSGASGTRFGMAMVQGHIYTVAGNGICGSAGDGGPALQAELWDPGALAVDSYGDVLVADQGNRSIRELASHTGTFHGVPLAADDLGTVAGEGSYGPYLTDGLPALSAVAEINFPVGIALDQEGNLYIADGAMHAIRFVPAAATTLLGESAQADDMYTAAGALSTGPLNHKTTWIQTRLLDPTGLAVSRGGRLIYSDTEANVVRELPAGS
jgi:DNA-binding beta-propeller fold protein YncE